MGIGDPYHKHPLTEFSNPPSTNCFHCESPINDDFSCYGCMDCDYYIHTWCQDLPIKLRHPLHDQHHLTLLKPLPNSSSSSISPHLLCNECQNPCVGRFAYHCTTCQFFFHLRCLFNLIHEKHDHPLIFDEIDLEKCKICGAYIIGLAFGCRRCEFYIHHECSLIPHEVKRHHVHELTLRHNFPEESDQVYCDLCEDRNGEMKRELSYYYCKRCDYIAHMHCCITEPRQDVQLCERFTHEHLLRPIMTELCFSCTQCSYVVSNDALEYPSTIVHPHKPRHTDEGEVFKYNHPLWKYDLNFICKNSMFRCDGCGELGKGSRVGNHNSSEGNDFDLHMECFALPGKLEHESHQNHFLYLRWLHVSTSQCCRVCTQEMNPKLWFYFCQECDFSAHIDCVAHDLLSTLKSSIKNQPDFCAIIMPDESAFKYQTADMRPCVSRPSYSIPPSVLEVNTDDDEGNYEIETDEHVLACPKCSSLIPTQASYSTIKHWTFGFLMNSTMTANDQTPSESEPLSLLEEQIIDELCCSICNMLIFPPTYSCASCQIFFHKSCAELPRKILFNETTYVLTAPPFPEGLSDCTCCKYPISSFAYLSMAAGFIFDVQCAAGAPLVLPVHHNHKLCFSRVEENTLYCEACKNYQDSQFLRQEETFMMTCDRCILWLHPECGLLPAVIKHRIHQHPLELATDLAELDCEYICDVCEKDLNPDLWAYRCVDICGKYATSHVSCVITSKKKCHFSYDLECQTWTEEKKLEFRRIARERGEITVDSTSVHVASDDGTCSSSE